MTQVAAVEVLILAAGRSTRMGRPKALLRFSAVEDFLGHILGEYRQAGIRGTVVIPDSLAGEGAGRDSTFRWVVNPEPERGRIHSVRLGLARAEAGASVIVQDVDRPFVTADLVRLLAARISPDAVTVPVCGGVHGHPVAIGAHLVARVASDAAAGSLREALATFPHRTVAHTDVRCDININSDEEYERHFAGLGTSAV